MDRQKTLPFGSPDSVKNDINRLFRALNPQDGGFIAQCEWGKHDPIENIMAVYSTWDELFTRRKKDNFNIK